MAAFGELQKIADVQTELLPHQQRVVDKIQQKNQPGLVVAHGLGSGKTFTSIAAQEALGTPSTVVAPAALLPNYQKERERHLGDDHQQARMQSLQLASRRGSIAKNPMLIVDEAHRLRDTSSSGYQAIKNNEAEKRLLLTGSPFYNHPSDIAPLVNIASGQNLMPGNREDFAKRYITEKEVKPSLWGRFVRGETPGTVASVNPQREAELRAHFKKWVDYHPGSRENFPEVERQDVRVPMSSEQLDMYDTLMAKAPPWVAAKVLSGMPPSKQESKQLNAFLTGSRQLSNTTDPFHIEGDPHSPKIEKAFSELQKNLLANGRSKAVVYSNYLKAGIDPYKARLDAAKIPYGEFTGEIGKQERDNLVKQYNENKLRVLLLSSAGGEGLDLKGTRLLQILEPHWNDEKLRQVEGRGARYKSHEGLPAEEQKLLIQRYMATRPKSGIMERLGIKQPGQAVDEYLTNMSQDKTKLIDQFKGLLHQEKQASALEDYVRHSALNLGQAARDARYIYDHPNADKVAPKGSLKHVASSITSRLPSLASNLYYTALPPQLHHTPEELAELSAASPKEWFLSGYAPWKHDISPERTQQAIKEWKEKHAEAGVVGRGLEGGKYLGYLVSVHPDLRQDVDKDAKDYRAKRFGEFHHVTLLRPKEVAQLKSQGMSAFDLRKAFKQIDPNEIKLHPQTRDYKDESKTFTVLKMDWPSAQAARKSLGLKPTGLHVTVGITPHGKQAGFPEVSKQAAARIMKLYHGSPFGGTKQLEPRLDPRTGKKALFAEPQQESAMIYSLLPDRAGSQVDYSTKDNKFTGGHVVSPQELLPEGHVYELEGTGHHADHGIALDAPTHPLSSRKVTQDDARKAGWTWEVKKAEFAPGLPDRKTQHPVPKLDKPATWEFGLHDHHSEGAAKRHFDLRLGDPDTGHAHSWAMKYWPKPGETRLAVMQPTHTLPYMDFKGRIEEGYGKGKVDLARRDKTEVVSASSGHVRFNLYPSKGVEEYLLRKTDDGNQWMLRNITATRVSTDLPSSKPPYKAIEPGKLDLADPNTILQAKVDGARVLYSFKKPGSTPDIFSYRPAERDTGLIEHTHRVPGVLGQRTPAALKNTVLRGELYAVDAQGKALPAHRVGGLLNSGVWKSREKQEQEGKLTPVVFDVVKWKGKDVAAAPYSEKLQLLEQVVKAAPWLQLPRTAKTPEEKQQLLKDVEQGKEPSTEEGVIEWHTGKSVPRKAKFREDREVYVHDVFKETGSRTGLAGGFTYTTKPGGPAVGKVGSGMSHDLKRDLLENPEKYKGLKANVQMTRGHVGRAPAFINFHLDQDMPEGIKMAEELL